MKRVLAVLMVLVLAVSLSSCSASVQFKSDSEDSGKTVSPEIGAAVSKAISELKSKWKEIYKDSNDNYGMDTDGYFEIKNTRVLTIRENDTDDFCDVRYIVEFVLFTDYYGLAPYYTDPGLYSSVSVYRNGKAEVKDAIRNYRARYYATSFSDLSFIESVEDLGSLFNCTDKLI